MTVVSERQAVWEKDTSEMEDLFDKAKSLEVLRSKKKLIEEALKQCNKDIDSAEKELSEEMIQKEVQSFVLKGKTFYLSTRTYASAIAETKTEFMSELKSNGYAELVIETVNYQTLSAFVREMLEETDELPKWIKPYVSVYEKTSIGIRKSK